MRFWSGAGRDELEAGGADCHTRCVPWNSVMFCLRQKQLMPQDSHFSLFFFFHFTTLFAGSD